MFIYLLCLVVFTVAIFKEMNYLNIQIKLMFNFR